MLALALLAPLPVAVYQSAGMPSVWVPSGGKVEATTHTVRFFVEKDTVTMESLLTLRNPGERAVRASVRLPRLAQTVENGPALAPAFPLTATLDGKPLPLAKDTGPLDLTVPTGAKAERADLAATFPMSARSTRALRVKATFAAGRTAADPTKRLIVYPLGTATTGATDVSFAFAPSEIVGLPDLRPAAGWSRTEGKAYRRYLPGQAPSAVECEWYSGRVQG
jgi:hypothetical protein